MGIEEFDVGGMDWDAGLLLTGKKNGPMTKRYITD